MDYGQRFQGRFHSKNRKRINRRERRDELPRILRRPRNPLRLTFRVTREVVIDLGSVLVIPHAAFRAVFARRRAFDSLEHLAQVDCIAEAALLGDALEHR